MKTIGKLLKYFIILLLSLILMLSITIGLIVWYYPAEIIAERIVVYGLNYYGFKYVKFDIKEASANKLIIENLNLGDPNNFDIKRIEADYTLISLLARKIDKVTIDGLKVSGLDNDNDNIYSFGTLDQLVASIKTKLQAQSQSGNWQASLIPTVNAVTITNSGILLNKPEQELTVPFSFSTESDKNKKDSYVSKVSFTQASINLDKLEIPGVGWITFTSRLSGTVPFIFDNKNLILTEGDVFSSQNGVIRFEPYKKPTSDQNPMLYNLFSDFQYKNLSAKITMDESKIVRFKFQFEGSNKNFYNGQSVKLNVNMTISAEDLIKYTNLMVHLRPQKD